MALACVATMLLVGASSVSAQVNSGSNGSDGVLNPTSNLVIDLADHPDGIYQYTSVNIPSGVTVTFIRNAANTPVVWLVQSDVVIDGTVELSGINSNGAESGIPGPGGFAGGNGGGGGADAGDGLGPGGGMGGTPSNNLGGNGSFSTIGDWLTGTYSVCLSQPKQAIPGEKYGNQFLVPLIGGSGGGGCYSPSTGGGGGGGALLIAANNTVSINGQVRALGGGQFTTKAKRYGGGGTGGAVRIVAHSISGVGTINCDGGKSAWNCGTSYDWPSKASSGFIRLDSLLNTFSGSVIGHVSRGYQPIILPPTEQEVVISITSIGGVSLSSSPNGNPQKPDLIIPGTIQNPVVVTLTCSNLPINSDITVECKPANGSATRVVGSNSQGTSQLSYATVQISIPRGAGTIQAKAVSGIVNQFASNSQNLDNLSIAQTGWLATGERFKAVEVTSTLGGGQSLVYISDSGQRYSLGN